MGTTDDAIHRLHRERIGGSMVAGIMGVSPWDSPFSVYQLMIGEAQPKEETAQMRRGKKHEGLVLREMAERTGLKLLPGNTIPFDGYGLPTVAQIDGYLIDADGAQPAEAKTTNPWTAEADWAGGEPPVHYLAQVQWQILHADARRAYVGAMWGLDEDQFRLLVVERDQPVIDAMLAACANFYHGNVVKRVPPMIDGHPATSTAVRQKFARSTPDMAKVLDAELMKWIDQRRLAIGELEHWQAVQDAADNQLKLAMADAEVAELPGWKLTWKTQTRSTIDAKRLRAELPDVAAKYTKTGESRPFVVKAVEP